MNYFDDIEFIHVVKRISNQNSSNLLNPKNWWGIGLMLGEGQVGKIVSDSHPPISLRMPFLYLVRPGDHSGWQVVNGASRENRWFIVSGPRAERMVTALSELLNGSSPAIYLERYTELVMIHQQMLELYQHQMPSQSYLLAICAEEFVGMIYKLKNLKERKFPVYRLISKISEQIFRQPESSFDFKKIARDNHFSYDYFRRCFQKYTGQTMRTFLLQKRLDHALNLLHNSSMRIKEVSDLFGFPRQTDFARFVRRKTGFTPSEIRKQHHWEIEG